MHVQPRQLKPTPGCSAQKQMVATSMNQNEANTTFHSKMQCKQNSPHEARPTHGCLHWPHDAQCQVGSQTRLHNRHHSKGKKPQAKNKHFVNLTMGCVPVSADATMKWKNDLRHPGHANVHYT